MKIEKANSLWDGWYVVRSNYTFPDYTLDIHGDVNIILCDGVTLNCAHGIRNSEKCGSCSLTIWGQEKGTGKLVADARGVNHAAGIGGFGDDEDGGTLVIHGGVVEAHGGNGAASIGGGYHGDGGTVIVTGGFVEACEDENGTGGSYCMSLASGYDFSGSDDGINTVTRDDVLVHTVSPDSGGGTSDDDPAAGIGGGEGGSGGRVTITGGEVLAKGGDDADAGTVIVDGGHVFARGYHAVGHGRGGYNGPRVNPSKVRVRSGSTDGEYVELSAYFAGASGGCSWCLDVADGALSIAPADGVSGTLADNDFPWLSCWDSIRSVTFAPGVSLPAGSVAMFDGCAYLASFDGSNADASRVTNARCMFRGCSSLTSLDLFGWYVSEVESASHMFEGCSSLASLDLSGWDFSEEEADASRMFEGCVSLSEMTVGWDFDPSRAFPEATSGTGRWWSVADGTWYTVDEIARSCAYVPDTYLSFEPQA